jgi:NitT/TauT family transport system permease protein
MAHLDVARTGSEKELSYAPVKPSRVALLSRTEHWTPLFIVALALAAWECAGRAGWISALYFPVPSRIATAIVQLLRHGLLAQALLSTLARVFAGFLFGGVPGLILGLMMGWSRRLRSALDPLVAVFHPVPKVALLPLVLMVFGLGEASNIVIISIAAFFPMLINSMAGVRHIRPLHLEVAANYGASRWKVFTRVILPGSLPLVLTGVRLALNAVLLLTIVVELLVARRGLGALMWVARETFRTEQLYASLFLIAALGFSFNFLLQKTAARVTRWDPKQS